MLKLWIVLVILAASAALWFTGRGLYTLFEYYHLDKTSTAFIQKWEIEEKGSDISILASYTFDAAGKTYPGKTKFKEPRLLNRFAAEQELKTWENMTWTVWYNGKHPEDSSLERKFPLNLLIQAFLTLGVLFYFYYIKKSLFRDIFEE